MPTKNIIPQLNKASTSSNGVGKLERLAEGTTELEVLIPTEGASPEAASPTLNSTLNSTYKERHANSRNYTQTDRTQLCQGKVCRWAKCQKSIRFQCPAYLWVIAEYERLQLAGRVCGAQKSLVTTKDAHYDERAEYREWLRELGRGSRYVSFGKEADNCGRWGMLKECEQGHKIIKRLVCGREWCPVCGQDDSEHHKRRIARLIDRVFSMDSVGYFVFEVPLAWRGYFEDVGMLRAASLYLSRMLGREGFPKAVRRWHYFGKPVFITGDNDFIGEDKKLELGKYHPHLNCLCLGGHIGKKKLRRIRRLWSNWLKVNCGQKWRRTAPVWYHYARSAGKKWHWVRYITRPTFKALTDGNRHIAADLFSFNNTSWWGVFSDADRARGRARFEAWLETLPERKKEAAVDVAAHDAYESGLCPVCGAETALVEGVVKVADYDIVIDYGGGLYHVHSPPGMFSVGEADADVPWGGAVNAKTTRLFTEAS